MDSLHLMHLNVAGLRAKKNELTQYVQASKPDVLCFNETRANAKPNPSIPGYQLSAFAIVNLASPREAE